MAYILLADDEPAAIQFAAAYLRKCEHRTVLCADGWEAIERLREERPDIVVTDVMLPREGGYGVIHELRQLYPDDTPAVILLSDIRADGRPDPGFGGPKKASILRHKNVRALAWQIVLAVESILFAGSERWPALPGAGLDLEKYGAPPDRRWRWRLFS